jgi:rubrerythrin
MPVNVNYNSQEGKTMREFFGCSGKYAKISTGEILMPVFGSVGHLIGLAIQSERALERLYRSMSEAFAQVPEVSGFWTGYAGEEAGHARWLENLRDKTGEELLDQLADPDILHLAERGMSTAMDLLLHKLTDLEEAFELANELEHAETNVVFEFLITNFANSKETESFLRSQLRDHVMRLENEFPTDYRDPGERRSVKAS